MSPILFVINSLEGGGAERVFASVTNELADRLDAPVEAVLLDERPEKYEIATTVPKTVLGAGGAMAASAARLTALAKKRRPRALVSFLARANCACVVAGAACGAPVVISERVHTTSHFGDGWRGALNRAAVRALYPRAHRVIAVSRGVAEELAASFGVPARKIATIHNPVDVEFIRAASAAPPPLTLPERFIVAVGRLSPNKNFAMLIEAYAASGIQDALVILGDGAERAALQRLAHERGVARRVFLCGHVDNPFPIVARAGVFVSASNAEGFPNALVEAMALARPVIAVDCPSGPAEILGGGLRLKAREVQETQWGMLTPMNDAAAMTNALIAMNGARRAYYGPRAATRARAFSREAALARYACIIGGVASSRGART